jgi:spore germination cell wall hydrolase CwlJ-like protein
MTRILRSAGLAAAAFAACASASTAAPADRGPSINQGSGTAGHDAPQPGPPSLAALVLLYEGPAVGDRQQNCLANAVYFESRGEPVEGQLAVADVVLNRAASGHYPTDLCAVVTQKAQFSFVRHGSIPSANRQSKAWRKAVAIAHIAAAKIAVAVPADVLWYHAAYVAPAWRRDLTVEGRIGLHIFYS